MSLGNLVWEIKVDWIIYLVDPSRHLSHGSNPLLLASSKVSGANITTYFISSI